MSVMLRHANVFWVCCLLIAIVSPAMGADYRIATDEQLLKALQMAGPGDAIRLNKSQNPPRDIFLTREDLSLGSVQELSEFLDRLGTSVPLYRFGRSGEKGRPVSFTGYKGGLPKINAGSGILQRGPVLGIDKDHILVGNMVFEQARMGAFLRDCDAALQVKGCTDVLIDNMTLRENQGGGAQVEQATNITILDTLFQDNQRQGSGGGLTAGPEVSEFMLRNARFIGNKASASGGGIVARSSLTITGNSVFSGNSAPVGGGVWLEASENQPVVLSLKPGARENVAFLSPQDAIAGTRTDGTASVVLNGEGTWTMRADCFVPAVVEKGRLVIDSKVFFASLTLKSGASLTLELSKRSTEQVVSLGNLDISGGGIQLTLTNVPRGKKVPFARYETFRPDLGDGSGLGFIPCKGGRVFDDSTAKELSVLCPR